MENSQPMASPKEAAFLSPVLDEAALTALSADIGADTVAEMIGIFRRDARTQLEKLATPTADKDGLIRAVHSLKGSAQSAGAAALAALASAAEARLKKEGGTDLPERQSLVDAFAAYEAAVTIKHFAAAA